MNLPKDNPTQGFGCFCFGFVCLFDWFGVFWNNFPSLNFHRATGYGPGNSYICSRLHYRRGTINFRKTKSIILNSMHAYPLFQRKILSFSSMAISKPSLCSGGRDCIYLPRLFNLVSPFILGSPFASSILNPFLSITCFSFSCFTPLHREHIFHRSEVKFLRLCMSGNTFILPSHFSDSSAGS